MKLRAAFRVLGLAGALFASACAELQVLLPAEDFQFELAGRIAVRYRDEASSGVVSTTLPPARTMRATPCPSGVVISTSSPE